MEREESFFSFIKRTVITFWAFVILCAMFLLTSVIISYIASIIYKELTEDKEIIIQRII